MDQGEGRAQCRDVVAARRKMRENGTHTGN